MELLLLFVGFALLVSFVCSLLEATLLSARLAMLSDLKAAGNRGAGLLLEIKRNRVDDAISAILIINTLANTLGATMAGAQASAVFGDQWVGVFSGVLTFLILVNSEIIPKTLGAVYSRALAGAVGWALVGLTKLMAPALVLSRALTGLLTRGEPQPISRGEIDAIIATATSEGALSAGESNLFANLLRLEEIRVEDVMTPRTVAFLMPVDATIGDLLAEPESEVFSRIPLYQGNRDNVVGYVLHRDVMKGLVSDGDRSRRLQDFMREITVIPEMISVSKALHQFLERRDPIATVTDEHGGLAGLVTLEDLTETMLGTEIVDESDHVVDLRQTAIEMRDRRLARLRRRREQVTGRADAD